MSGSMMSAADVAREFLLRSDPESSAARQAVVRLVGKGMPANRDTRPWTYPRAAVTRWFEARAGSAVELVAVSDKPEAKRPHRRRTMTANQASTLLELREQMRAQDK